MPRWTEEQQQAIDLEGTNIIVSAGAGSGKTAVLTARVLRKLKAGTHIDELLILTFTKAAASEMKERIRAAIQKEPSLKGELDYLDAAYITTFDSYALSIVRKYHDLLNVSKSISVMDSTVIQSVKKHYLEEIFEELYREKEPNFLKLIGDFCLKDDASIKSMILSISNKLDLRSDKTVYLTDYMETRFTKERISEDIQDYVALMKKKVENFHYEIKRFSTYVDSDYIEKIETIFEPLFSASTYEEFYHTKLLKFPSLPRGLDEEVKERKQVLTNLWKEIIEYLSYPNEEAIQNTIFLTKDYVRAIIQLILRLDQKMNRYKYQKDAYEFTDIALLAIQIVKEHEEVREEIKQHFKEILIDEYQDTNDLQETFIQMISNHNVYMVGDIKQSIYRFRNANPYLFKQKYETYQKRMDGIKIDLNKNFRSRKEVLEDINYLFDYWMDSEIGGADYRGSHEMVFGNETYLKEGYTKQNYHFEIYNYNLEKGSPYKKEEVEAFMIARDIQKKMRNHDLVFDKDLGVLREMKYSDCVILMDRTTNFDLYKKIFEYLNIPLTLYKDESITNEMDLYVLKNILKLLKKMKLEEYDQEFQYCYTSIARSFLFSISDEEILNVFLKKNFKDTEIYQIASEILLDYDSKTCKQLLQKIMTKFPFYEKIVTLGNVESAMVRFEYLENMAENLTTLGYTIFDFTDYLEEMVKENTDIRYASNTSSGDSCKIMTIHKSKGLEFPICYFSGLSKKFNMDDLKERFLYDSKYGIITPYVKEGIGTLFYKELIGEEYKKEEVSEKIRLLYVALTRAKEKMIFITSLPLEGEIEKENGLIVRQKRMQYRSFQDMFLSLLPMLKNYRKEIDLEHVHLTKDYMLTKKISIFDVIPRTEQSFILKELDCRSKIQEEHSFSKTVGHLLTPIEKKNMEFGIQVHEILEYLDFKNPSFENLNPFLERKIRSFFEIPFLQNLKDATIYQEYEFYDPESSQIGIIDCMIEWDDHIILIDYKLKNIKEEAYRSQLKGYCHYIEKQTKKKVELYLYSILEEKLEKID